MAKLIELKEAAAFLGITPEALVELRNRNEISGYRDGNTWKFKENDLERLAAAKRDADSAAEGSSIQLDRHPLAEVGSSIDADLDDLVELHISDADLGAEDEEDEDVSIVAGDEDSGDPNASSTVIGKKDAASLSHAEFAEDIDDLLAESSAIELGAGNSSPRLDPNMSGSDLRLSGDSAKGAGTSDLLDLEPQGGSGATGELGTAGGGGEDMLLGADADLALSGDDLEQSSGSSEELLLSASASDLNLGGASDLNLAPSDTGVDLHGGGGDVTKDASDSGISLGSPGDSGISLEQTPPEIVIGGDALELGEADLLDLDDELADLDDATELQSGQDFLLEPVRGDLGEESDSGSQVIALDSEEFDESAATVARGDGPDFVEEEDGKGRVAPLGAVPSIGAVAETQYPVWVVVLLGMIAIPLGLTGLMLFDAIRFMWSWNEPFSLNSTLMDGIVGMFGR